MDGGPGRFADGLRETSRNMAKTADRLHGYARVGAAIHRGPLWFGDVRFLRRYTNSNPALWQARERLLVEGLSFDGRRVFSRIDDWGTLLAYTAAVTALLDRSCTRPT